MRNQEWDQSLARDHMASGQGQEGSQGDRGDQDQGQTWEDGGPRPYHRDHTAHLTIGNNIIEVARDLTRCY